MSDRLTPADLLKISAKITSAYISNHKIELDNVQDIFKKMHKFLKSINDGIHSYRQTGPLVPAVPIEESIANDYIVCLEDGKKLQMLRRHLSTVYNMTPEQYKERWGLSPDYPIVAPSYAKKRSEIAKTTGLGTTGRKKKAS